MRKFTIFLSTSAVVIALGYLAYVHFFSLIVAESITGNTSIPYLPKEYKSKIEKIKKPVNDIANEVVHQTWRSEISIKDILKAIDNTKEDQALAFLKEINTTEIKSTDQVFTIAKKHFPVDFDVEIFREPFNAKVNLKQINKGIQYANQYTAGEAMVDVTTAKSIAKKILLQKEKEFNALVKQP